MKRSRRERTIEKVKRRLMRKSLPRVQVSLILLLTGLAGFLASFSLLRLGLGWMWLRYPIAILFAYCVFLLLLRLWLSLQRSQHELPNPELDLSAVEVNYSPLPSYNPDFKFSGGGGDAGGGGAGGSWGGSSLQAASPSSSASSGGGGGGGSFLDNIDLDLEGGWLLIVALVAIIGGLLAAFYVIYAAPALLAEILVDGVLLTGLYKQMKRIEQRHWLRSAVRRTLLPALLATIFFSIAGYALQRAVPEAHSIGEVWKHVVKS
ncbi:MAG TPA: hypothetical protein VGX92_14925 [Pyrinomonadaceae bacterium]|jgi:hypothetical protein|nr:hypothetical protein [Pyrinomonadaceae bacterium]